jgi:membrane-associated protease RseP (regulator of RpoE activity)
MSVTREEKTAHLYRLGQSILQRTTRSFPPRRLQEGGTTRTFPTAVVLFASLLSAHPQDQKPFYGIGATFVTGFPSGVSCPIFIGGVWAISPASKAGLQPGDLLVSVDAQPVKNLQDTSRVTSASPGVVTLGLIRGTTSSTVTIQREDYSTILRHNGLKMVHGFVVDLDTTIESARSGDRRVVFTDRHYPVDKTLYYPGFEVFVWNKGTQITVGGIEDGPAKRSGARWGDHILAVNGVDPHGKSDAEMESLLSSSTPKPMTLSIERAGVRRTFSFDIERADDVLRDNHFRVADGKIVPSWVPENYLLCFEH